MCAVMVTEDPDKRRKKSLINQKLSELCETAESKSTIIHNFLIWFGEMEHMNWNGKQTNGYGKRSNGHAKKKL